MSPRMFWLLSFGRSNFSTRIRVVARVIEEPKVWYDGNIFTLLGNYKLTIVVDCYVLRDYFTPKGEVKFHKFPSSLFIQWMHL